jgi:hypothetical protein
MHQNPALATQWTGGKKRNPTLSLRSETGVRWAFAAWRQEITSNIKQTCGNAVYCCIVAMLQEGVVGEFGVAVLFVLI